jgi:hypothetical protein
MIGNSCCNTSLCSERRRRCSNGVPLPACAQSVAVCAEHEQPDLISRRFTRLKATLPAAYKAMLSFSFICEPLR